MKKLALWARDHTTTARAAIIISYIFLNILALFLGDIIHSFNIEFPPLFFLFALAMTLVGWMIYPIKSRKKEYRNFFARQKSADFLLVSATFLFIVYAGNSMNRNWSFLYNPAHAISIIKPASSTHITNPSAAKTSVSKKSFRKKIRVEIKRIRKAYKESSKSHKTLYIILAIVGATALMVGLAAVACGIGCSGSVIMSYGILIIGSGWIIFGLAILIKRITRSKPKG